MLIDYEKLQKVIEEVLNKEEYEKVGIRDLKGIYENYNKYVLEYNLDDTFASISCLCASLLAKNTNILAHLPKKDEIVLSIILKLCESPICTDKEKNEDTILPKVEYPSYFKTDRLNEFKEKVINKNNNVHNQIQSCYTFLVDTYEEALVLMKNEEKVKLLKEKEDIKESIKKAMIDNNVGGVIGKDKIIDKIVNYYYFLKEENPSSSLVANLVKAVELSNIHNIVPIGSKRDIKSTAYDTGLNFYFKNINKEDEWNKYKEENSSYLEFKKDVYIDSNLGDNTPFLSDKLDLYTKYFNQEILSIKLNAEKETVKFKIKEM